MANLSGTSGNDSLVGTAGDDTLDVRAASAGVTVNFADGTKKSTARAKSPGWPGGAA